jgi:hypothetical protein
MSDFVLISLVLSQTIAFASLLVYFFLKDKKQDQDRKSFADDLKGYFQDVNKKSETVFVQTFNSYLKHISNLEKMVLPKPITQKMVEDVLKQTPPIVREVFVENEIDKVEDDGIKITESNFNKIPIGQTTKVMFEEGDDMPTVVE